MHLHTAGSVLNNCVAPLQDLAGAPGSWAGASALQVGAPVGAIVGAQLKLSVMAPRNHGHAQTVRD